MDILTWPFRSHGSTMGASDALMWNIEYDPQLRSTVTVVALLDRSPDWSVLRQRVDAATEILPRLRQRAADAVSPLGLPAWVDDDDFDLDYHLRRVRCPEPGTTRALLDLAEPIAMQAFDRARPLWELTVVDGMELGHAALIQKFHHSMMDGEGAVAFARALLDHAGDPAERGHGADPTRVAPSPTTVDRGVGLARTVVDRVTDPIGSVRRAAALVESIGKAVAPVPESASPVLTRRGLSRRFDAIDVRLEDLRAAGHGAGGTVNDAFLAAVVGGLAAYHERLDAPVDHLRLTMPVSVRRASDPVAGNRFAPVRFEVPTTIDDPAERISTLGAIARSWEHEPFLQHTELIAGALARLPARVSSDVFGSMLKNVDAVATNVAGLPGSAALAGAAILREYAFAPPTGAGLNISLVSHGEVACIGVVVDTAAVTHLDVFMACLTAAFDEVVATVDHHTRRTA